MLSFDLVNQFELIPKNRIYGYWDYEIVTIDGEEFKVSDLNECGHRDVLKIRRNSEIEEYEFDGKKFKGVEIGISNTEVCSLSPASYKYVVVNSSCTTRWIRLISNRRQMVSIGEGVVIEYEIEKLNRKTMALSKISEVVNYGSKEPDKIVLRKMRKEN